MPIAVPNNSNTKPKFQLATSTRERLERSGIDLSAGYPYYPPKPKTVADATKVRNESWEHIDAGNRADKSKKGLLEIATEVNDIGAHIGTELKGIQLSQLSDSQKDELALLISERTVVFLPDQDITPAEQRELGAYLGVVEVHPTAAAVPGLPGVSVISDQLSKSQGEILGFRNPFGTQNWHTDLTHENQPPGYTHLHIDHAPTTGGETLWSSGYSAYDKFSPKFRSLIEQLDGVYRSAHKYPNPEDPDGPHVHITRTHPLVRVHPVTGWKSVFANSRYTIGIEGLDDDEAQAILKQIFKVYEQSLDIQVRYKLKTGTSALWDNRVSIHAASYDYEGKGEPRHGTRVSSLAEKPYFEKGALSRRAALGLDKDDFLSNKKTEY